MTIPEACELVVQAGAIGQDGHVMVLDMGKPVRIAEVARRLITESGRSIKIIYTGLRQGEKLHEDLFGDLESSTQSGHPLISCVSATPMAPSALGIESHRWNGNPLVGRVIDLRGTVGLAADDEASGSATRAG